MIGFFSWLGDVVNGIAPKRPDVEDVGSLDYQNVPGAPPNERYMWRAEKAVQMSQQIAGMARTTSPIRITVRFQSGTPFVHSVAIVSGGRLIADFEETDNGTGDTTITWPENTIPPVLTDPMVSINGTTPGSHSIDYVTNGIRVKTLNGAGAAADLPWTATIG